MILPLQEISLQELRGPYRAAGGLFFWLDADDTKWAAPDDRPRVLVQGSLRPVDVIAEVELECPECSARFARRLSLEVVSRGLDISHHPGPLGHEHLVRPKPIKLYP